MPDKDVLSAADVAALRDSINDRLNLADGLFQKTELQINVLKLVQQLVEREKQTIRDVKKLAKQAGIDLDV